MRKILLYGELGNRFGREHYLDVRNPAEAIQAFCVNFSGFRTMLQEAHKFGIGFKVFVGASSLREAKETLLPSSERDTIRISPTIFGSGAVDRIIIGALLVASGYGILALPGLVAAEAAVGSAMIKIGAALVLGSLAQMLSESPPGVGSGDTPQQDVNGQSYLFDGPENVSRAGGCVPIGYGRMIIGSTVISAGIEDSNL